MNRALTNSALAAAAALAFALLVGCGGGGGSTGSGALEGTVYVPQSLSDAAASTDRAGAPPGYAGFASATVQATVGSQSRSATTDSNGHFRIIGLPAGKASVTVTPPPGLGYLALNTTVDIVSGATASIGQDGSVSLVSNFASNLSVALNQVDTSDWPLATLHISVTDPNSDALILGLIAGNFTVSFGESEAVIVGVELGEDYVVTAMAQGDSSADYVEVRAECSGKSGTATQGVPPGVPTEFVPPILEGTVTAPFKAVDYASTHPGVWHAGVDTAAPAGTPIFAIANGEVVRVIWTGLGFEETALIIKHRLNEEVQTAEGPTTEIYARYGNINPFVVGAHTQVAAGQKVGELKGNSQGTPHLHFAVRVGQDDMSLRADQDLVDGRIPDADEFGLTDGWTDPYEFINTHLPDNEPPQP